MYVPTWLASFLAALIVHYKIASVGRFSAYPPFCTGAMASKNTKYSRAQVATHSSWTSDKDKRDVWCIYENKVIDMTSFVEEHPVRD